MSDSPNTKLQVQYPTSIASAIFTPRKTDNAQLTTDPAPFSRAALLILCLLTALVGRLCLWPIPLEGDGYMFVYMGKLISEGGRFQHDIIDNKLPTVGLLMSVPWKCFGACGIAYLLLQVAMAMFGSLLLSRSAARHFGPHARRPTLLAAMLLLNFTFIVNGGFQLETVQAFFTILAASSALEALHFEDPADAFAAGLAGGVAAMVKPTGLAILGAFALAAIFQFIRRPRKLFVHGSMCAIGLAIPAAVTLAYLIGADNLRDMPGLLKQISLYANRSLWEPWDLSKPITAAAIIGFPLLVRGWIFRRDRVENRVPSAMVLFTIAWLSLEFLGVVLQWRMYAYHFLVLAAPAALLFGMVPRRDRVWPTLASLAPIMVLSLWSTANVIDGFDHRKPPVDLAAYLRPRTKPGDYIWRDGVMPVLIETDLRSGSRMPMTFLFMNSDDSPLLYAKTIIDDFQDRRPIYVVLPSDVDFYTSFYSHHLKELGGCPQRQKNFVTAWHEIETYVHAHYVSETQLGRETVYRRADEPMQQAGVQ